MDEGERERETEKKEIEKQCEIQKGEFSPKTPPAHVKMGLKYTPCVRLSLQSDLWLFFGVFRDSSLLSLSLALSRSPALSLSHTLPLDLYPNPIQRHTNTHNKERNKGERKRERERERGRQSVNKR